MKDRIRTEKLIKVYKKRAVVNEVSIDMERGEIVGLLGPNGAGKTTTFYIITGVIKPNGGKVYLNDMDITLLPMYKRARMGVGYLPQEASIFRKMKVYDNIYGVLEINGFKREECKNKTEEIMEMMGVAHLRDSYGYSLSGGERRRVEIARSLVLNPKFLLLDEPFTGIDPKTREEIQEIIVNLKKYGIGVLITDHNVRETLEITDRAYIIYEGKVLLEGNSEFLVNDEQARRIYLGEKFRL